VCYTRDTETVSSTLERMTYNRKWHMNSDFPKLVLKRGAMRLNSRRSKE
jgi:hypothetical protein